MMPKLKQLRFRVTKTKFCATLSAFDGTGIGSAGWLKMVGFLKIFEIADAEI